MIKGPYLKYHANFDLSNFEFTSLMGTCNTVTLQGAIAGSTRLSLAGAIERVAIRQGCCVNESLRVRVFPFNSTS